MHLVNNGQTTSFEIRLFDFRHIQAWKIKRGFVNVSSINLIIFASICAVLLHCAMNFLRLAVCTVHVNDYVNLLSNKPAISSQPIYSLHENGAKQNRKESRHVCVRSESIHHMGFGDSMAANTYFFSDGGEHIWTKKFSMQRPCSSKPYLQSHRFVSVMNEGDYWR